LKSEIESRLREILSTFFEVPTESVDRLSRDASDEWDSLKHIQLMILLEEELKIEITDSDMEQMKNFNEIIRIITSKNK
jgi:acyl carrier protein